VAKVRFSRRAEADFDDITAYTVRTWDAAQADRYLTLLDDYCQRLGGCRGKASGGGRHGCERKIDSGSRL
jgi:plasmid stabilization system protein ParE